MEWCGGEVTLESEKFFTIKTLEGDHTAIARDWIVKGIHGEFYPVKPAIFKKTYEEA